MWVPSISVALGDPFRPACSLVVAHPQPCVSLAAFADDLAAVILNVVSGLGTLLDVFMMLPLATGLHFHIPKVAIIN